MGRKTTVWIFQETNRQNLTRENLDLATEKETFWKKLNLFKQRQKQRHKDQLC